MTAERYDAFVSYGHGDAGWAQALAENLRRLGPHVFLDRWGLVAGDLIAVRLQEGLAPPSRRIEARLAAGGYRGQVGDHANVG
jgi:hypothetical protein